MVKKKSEFLKSKEFYEAYTKAFKYKPSKFKLVMNFLLGLWTLTATITVFAVLTKLIIMSWKWLL